MSKQDWVWMPHAGHFILGDKCRFHLNTYVGDYIVSTIGELWGDQSTRRIHAEVHDKVYKTTWYAENSVLKGDAFDAAYMKQYGYEDLGAGDRKYETMVFKAKKSNVGCCPYEMVSGENVDFRGYESAEAARIGHMELCIEWSKKSTPEIIIAKNEGKRNEETRSITEQELTNQKNSLYNEG